MVQSHIYESILLTVLYNPTLTDSVSQFHRQLRLGQLYCPHKGFPTCWTQLAEIQPREQPAVSPSLSSSLGIATYTAQLGMDEQDSFMIIFLVFLTARTIVWGLRVIAAGLLLEQYSAIGMCLSVYRIRIPHILFA